MKCVVLGAGVAGLVAALELQKRSCEVTLIEAGPRAGGRTSSWSSASGLESGTGLHVVADHYVNLLDVLRGVDALGQIVWWHRHQYLRPAHPAVIWRYNSLPAPFHLLHAARTMPVRGALRLSLLRAGVEAAGYRQSDLSALDDIPYMEWHESHRLGDGFIRDLADLAADAATFLPLDRVAARPVLSWLKYMSRNSAAGRIGTWRLPLYEGLVAPLVRAFGNRGGTLLTSVAVRRLEIRSGTVASVVVSPSTADRPFYQAAGAPPLAGPERVIPCESVISALPVQALRTVLDSDLACRAGLCDALKLTTTPAVSAVIRFDRNLAARLSGAPLATGCVFRDFADRSSPSAPDGHSDLQFLMSRAEQWIEESDQTIVDAIVRDFSSVWPSAQGAVPVDATVERIGSAMFAAVPGAHRLRPPTETAIPNLFLAGDWIRHDCNASMEGAALSGRLAARAALRAAGRESAGSPVPVLHPEEPLFCRVLQRCARPVRYAAGGVS
jgi:zeta-carotene desaturase